MRSEYYRLYSLRKRCFAAAIFGFVGAPDFSPAIEVGLIQGFSPWDNIPAAKAGPILAA